MICTFGLINRGKGLEYMIQAMPRIVAACPDAMYLIVGATHPQVKRQEGEVYRESLVEMAEVAGRRRARALREPVSQPCRTCWSTCRPATCTSLPIRAKTRSPAAPWPMPWRPAGRWSARPTCTPRKSWPKGAGLLVPFADSAAMADATLRFLSDTAFRLETRRTSLRYAKPMFWPNVGRQYLDLFDRLRRDAGMSQRKHRSQASTSAPPRHGLSHSELVHGGCMMHVRDAIALDHLDRMTDSTGLIQHAIYSIPRRESGYTTDDNARALRSALACGRSIRTSGCSAG